MVEGFESKQKMRMYFFIFLLLGERDRRVNIIRFLSDMGKLHNVRWKIGIALTNDAIPSRNQSSII